MLYDASEKAAQERFMQTFSRLADDARQEGRHEDAERLDDMVARERARDKDGPIIATHSSSRTIGGAGWSSTRDDCRPITDVTAIQAQLQQRRH